MCLFSIVVVDVSCHVITVLTDQLVPLIMAGVTDQLVLSCRIVSGAPFIAILTSI
jgi:hypothetical protein